MKAPFDRQSTTLNPASRPIAALLALALAALACAAPAATPTVAPTATASALPSPTASATFTAPPTATQTATPTQVPPTQTPTIIPSPTMTPMPTPEVLLQDNFADNHNKWDVGQVTGGDDEIVGGSMVMTITRPGWTFWTAPKQSGRDVDQTVDVEALDSSGAKLDVGYGAVCRAGPLGTYQFELHPGGYYDIALYSTPDKKWTVLASGQDEEAVLPPPQTNTLRTVCAGDELTLIVNGKLLAVVQDNNLSAGRAGLEIGTYSTQQFTARFRNLSVLLPDHHFYSQPVLFEGGRLVYAFAPLGVKAFQLISANTNGTEMTTLTDIRQGNISGFSISPDGKSIVYSWETGQSRRFELRTIAPDGSGEAVLIPSTATDSAISPAWSPDGKKIAYVDSQIGNHKVANDIYVAGSDGSNPVAITAHGAALSPAWSPDGTKIAYIWWAGQGDAEIHVIDASGGNDVNLTPNAATAGIEPFTTMAWSPDGSRIAFISNRDGSDDIYTMDPQGGHVTRLTFDPSSDTSPSWTPDSQYILFASDRGGTPLHLKLYVMNADGSGTRMLASSSNGDSDLPELLPQP